MEPAEVISKARRCLQIEIAALLATRDSLSEDFVRVVSILQKTLEKGGKLIFSGVGKNAPICQKLVGTFNSIGAPSTFLDCVQALHGDLGLCREGDVLLAFSNSGETSELLRFLPMAQRFDITSIAVTSRASSTLARMCDATLPYEVQREACPLDLAPTASTSAALAIGDAVAMVLLELSSLSREDFAKNHPAGSLGQQLAPKVEAIMRPASRLAASQLGASCRDCLAEMSQKASGCIVLLSESGQLAGILTDGDIRRGLLAHEDFLDRKAQSFMSKSPVTIAGGSFAAQALKAFETHNIDDLVVVDADNRPIGVIDGQDLAKLRIV